MSASFVVYIDESGDEGFRSPKSPEWFVLAAVITRAQHDAATVRLVDETRKILGKQPTTALHFQRLDHKQRVPYLNKIVEYRKQLRAIALLIHKPSIAEVEWFSQKDRLYQYATRYLLERVSWFCRDHKERTDPDGSARITFSNRSNTSYDSIREYISHLRKISDLGTERIELNWNVIKPEQIEAKPHQDRKGLQIADAIASSFYFVTPPRSACRAPQRAVARGRRRYSMPKTLARGLSTYLTRRRWTPKEAKAALSALAQSGLPLATFASHKGLDAQRLVRWRRRLGADAPETLTFEEVSARPIASSFGGGATPPSERDRFELVLRSGLVVRVAESFTTDALRRLLDVFGEVRSC